MSATCKKQSFHVNQSQCHIRWDNSLTPVLTVESGSEISLDMKDGSNNQIHANSTIQDVIDFDTNIADPAFGPVYVNGAEPGDVLKVEFLDLKCGTSGWTAVMEGFGVLAEDFPEPQLKLWDLSEEQQAKGYAVFKKGIHIPLRPFLGVVGVAPAEDGEFLTVVPLEKIGGNIDCKYITQGSTLYLPVRVPGALFSCGDGHAAQGDGESCGSAIETAMKATIRLTVEKNKPWIQVPQYLTNAASLRQAEVLEKGEYACLGVDSDLLQAAKNACRQMIVWLSTEKGLSKVEAYMLISVAGDLKIVEAVDMPNYAVAMSIPLSIFVEEDAQ